MSAPRSRLLSSSLWAMTGNGTQYIVVFVLLLYLARVLEPRDFGLMATVSAGLDLGTRIARWGQVELLQQPRYRGDAAYNRSLRLSFLIAGAFALLFVALAQPLARHFGSPMLAVMMIVCAPVFLFSAAGSTAEAVLRSEFRFRTLAIRGTVPTLIGGLVAIALAKMGQGALALAVQRLVQAICSGVWIWVSVEWRPSFRRHIDPVPGLAREGATVMAGTLLPVAIPRSIDLLVGFFMGPVQLGLMRVAGRINEFVGQMVAMPLLSVANAELPASSHDLAAMRRSYLRLVQASALMMCPALIGLTLVAPEAVPFIFGPKWRGAVPFVEITGLLGLVLPINFYFAPAAVAIGRSRLLLRQGAIQLLLGVLFTAIAAQVSLVAIAVAQVVRVFVVSCSNLYDLHRFAGLRYRAFLHAMAPPYLATLAMALVVLACRPATAALAPNLRLAVLVALGGTGFCLTLALLAGVGLWPDCRRLVSRLAQRRQHLPG